MEVVNPFILKNKAKMIKFLDDIAVSAGNSIFHKLSLIILIDGV